MIHQQLSIGEGEQLVPMEALGVFDHGQFPTRPEQLEDIAKASAMKPLLNKLRIRGIVRVDLRSARGD